MIEIYIGILIFTIVVVYLYKNKKEDNKIKFDLLKDRFK